MHIKKHSSWLLSLVLVGCISAKKDARHVPGAHQAHQHSPSDSDLAGHVTSFNSTSGLH